MSIQLYKRPVLFLQFKALKIPDNTNGVMFGKVLELDPVEELSVKLF